MFKKTLVFLVTAFMLATASAALAQTGNYPANSAIIVRDANGNIIDGTHGLHVGDPMHIVSSGWKPSSSVAFDFFSTVIHLGDVNADATGTVDATFPVPNVEPGQHTLRLTGVGADGKPRTVDYPILVVPASQVLGSTLDNAGNSSALGSSGSTSTGTGGVFGKTGLDHALDIAGVGLALLAVGLVLTLAVRRSRREDAFV